MVLDNPNSRIEVLQENPGCLADCDDIDGAPNDSVELLSQLLLTSAHCGLKKLYINGTGLTKAGATRLSTVLARQFRRPGVLLQHLRIGGPGDPVVEKTMLESSATALPRQLELLCSNQDPGLAHVLANALRINNTVRTLWLEQANLSALEWCCIFETLASRSNHTLSYLEINDAPGLDHTVIPYLDRLCLANPSLVISDVVGAPLRGNRLMLGITEGLFHCCCARCTEAAQASPS